MLFRFAIALVIGLAVGAWTASSSIRADIGVGSLSVGPWTAWPLEGSKEADPYTKAKVAAEGAVPLGVGEGVEFEAVTDSSGRPLDAACDYKVLGRTPKARIWTLTAHAAAPEGVDGPAMLRPDGAVAALTSRDLVRREDGSFAVSLGPHALARQLDRPSPPDGKCGRRPRRAVSHRLALLRQPRFHQRGAVRAHHARDRTARLHGVSAGDAA